MSGYWTQTEGVPGALHLRCSRCGLFASAADDAEADALMVDHYRAHGWPVGSAS